MKLKEIDIIRSFLWMLIVCGFIPATAQVTFKATAPATVVEGEQFRLSYVLNKTGKDLRLPEINDFDLLFGPTTTQNFKSSTINGKTTSERSVSYTYILMPKKTGTFTIPPASITVDGDNYKSNSLQIKVLPPDDTSTQNADGRERADRPSTPAGTVSGKDAFIRAILSKNAPYEQEGFTVTFRLYTTLNIVNYGKIQFPEFEGFMVEEVPLPANQQLRLERYQGRNYYTVDLKKSLLFPQRSGKITIPSGTLEMVFSVPSGKKISTFFGTQEISVDVKKTFKTNPLTVNVKPLPGERPDSYANAVGTLNLKSGISSTQVKANEAITLTLQISGIGNLKLIRNPIIAFPKNFEEYDPTVNNAFNVTENGLSGMRTIEYMVIPRYEGNYTVPPLQFTYFDLNTAAYKTLTTPAYELKIARGDPSALTTGSFVSRKDVEVEHDIRFLKTEAPLFHATGHFFAGSLRYWLWYITPSLLLLIFSIINRKKARENANVALMRTKKANKVAIKRMKRAGHYLKAHDKEHFYDEVLRALWGYFSDKLSIPVARLSKSNIEEELSIYGISDTLVELFMQIMDTCEFARYAPAESDAQMDKLYQETLKAIGEMENRLRKK